MRHRRTGLAWILAGTALFLLPNQASAHAVMNGWGAMGNGFAHPFTTTAHVLLLVALGLFLGQHWSTHAKAGLSSFTALAVLGLVFSACYPRTHIPEPVLVSFALVTGILIALNAPIPGPLVAVIFGGCGLALGMDSGFEAESVGTLVKMQMGTLTSFLIVVFDLGIYIMIGMTRKWVTIGVRILGSWVTAIAMLVLAFALKR